MSVDESNIVKKITLGTVDTDENTFNDETKNIGAEAENIIVSYNNHNEIITDLAHNTVDHNEPLAITLRDMKSTFQAGVDAIYNAEVAEEVSGVPTASTPTALADGVGTIATAKRTQGQTDKGDITLIMTMNYMGGTLNIEKDGEVTWSERFWWPSESQGSQTQTYNLKASYTYGVTSS